MTGWTLRNPGVSADVPTQRVDARRDTVHAAVPAVDLLAAVETKLPPGTQTLAGALGDVRESKPVAQVSEGRGGSWIHAPTVARRHGPGATPR
jgi:hypothetical protein